MRNCYKLVGIITALTALSTNASRYFCTNENMDRLVINYDPITHVPTSTYSFLASEQEESRAPLDGSIRFSVQPEGDMLSSTIEAGTTKIEIRFEDADQFEEMMCKPSRDSFGMPILAPRCEKKALMITYDEMGIMMSTMPFTCDYLAN